MQLSISRDDAVLTAALIGELDHHTAAEIREKIDAAILQERCATLILDLSGLTFMDSSGIGLIMGRYRLMQTLGGTLQLIHVPPAVDRLIQLAGLYKLPIRETKETENRKDEQHETHQ